MSNVGVYKAARMKSICTACGKNGLNLTAEERHDVQMQVVGKASLTAMSLEELNRVLDHVNAKLGYTGHAGKPKGLADDPQLRKIEALLADMKLPWAYIHKSSTGPSMVRRLTGKDRIEWADGPGKTAVITALCVRQAKLKGG